MSDAVSRLVDRIRDLEQELADTVAERGRGFRYRIRDRCVEFEQGVVAGHRKQRRTLIESARRSGLAALVVAPVIYSLIVPLVVLDLWLTLYQWICFPAYGIAKIRRSQFFLIDRQHLQYLNRVQRINCAYCGYATGVTAYARELASLTELRWCPIKHASRPPAPHHRYFGFSDYGDADGYRERSGEDQASASSASSNGSAKPGS